jgi:hypothetical protein
MTRYPFSAKKHAHDIELLANRSFNLAYEARDNGDLDEYDRLMSIHDEANEVLDAIMCGMQGWSGVTMLTGAMIGKAKEMVLIADNIREGLYMQYEER